MAFLEALINELLKDAADGHSPYLEGLTTTNKAALGAYWSVAEGRQKMLEKFQVSLALCHRATFDLGAAPYQDVSLVVELRNALTHFRPLTASSSDQSKFERKFLGKFDLCPTYEGASNPIFPDHLLGHGCVNWAVEASVAFADEFSKRLGIVPNYQRVSFKEAPGKEVSDED